MIAFSFEWNRWISRAAWCLILTWCHSSKVLSQDFSQYYCLGKNQGLPSNSVHAIAQDSNGFMWFGTSQGLARYDGFAVKIYSIGHRGSSGSDDRINSLLVDRDQLWIGHHHGLSRLNLMLDSMKHIRISSDSSYTKDAVITCFKDSFGKIWIGTKHYGFGYYDNHADTMCFFQLDKDQLSNQKADYARTLEVLSFVQDIRDDSIMWVGTYGGLVKFDQRNSSLKHYYFDPPNNFHQGSVNAFRLLHQTNQGQLYMASWHTGLNKVDIRNSTLDPVVPYLPGNNDHFFAPIRSLFQNDAGKLSVTSTIGLATYDLNAGKYLSFDENIGNEIRQGIDFIDLQGRTYLKHSEEGLRVFDPAHQQFQTRKFADLNQGGLGFVYEVIWDEVVSEYYVAARAADALYRYHRGRNQWVKTAVPPAYFSLNQVQCTNIVKERQDRLILSTYAGLLYFYPDKNVLLPTSFDLPKSIERIGTIYMGSKNRLWISTNRDGIYYIDLTTSKTHSLYNEAEYDLHLGNSQIFFEDSRGNLYIKSNLGFRLLKADGTFIKMINPEIDISDKGKFVEDGYGRVWLSYNRRALGYVSIDEPEKGIILGREMKMVDQIHHLDRSPDGYLWCVTTENLIKLNFDMEIQNVIKFNYSTNTNDFFSFFIDQNNIATLGGRNQIVQTNLNSLTGDINPPKPYITDINVKESPYPCGVAYQNLKALELGPTENFFSISYSAMTSRFGQENRFRYRLEGFQDTWIEVGNRNYANFTNVPSGDYVFSLQAANHGEEWSDLVFSLPISIKESFFEKLEVQIILLAIIFGIGYALYRLRIAKIREGERLKTAFQKKLNSVEMSALRAQMNPHFIFNCLNSIESFIVKNDTINASNYLNDFARLIRLILKNSRSRFVTLAQEIEAIELYLQMERLRFDNQFKYEMKIDQSLDTQSVEIPPMLIQPYIENAIWHGLMHKENGGTLTVEIRKEVEAIRCSVIDDGIGRRESQRINAQKFSRPKESYGMTITQDRIETINALYDLNASVKITDLCDAHNVPSGTRVDLFLPI